MWVINPNRLWIKAWLCEYRWSEAELRAELIFELRRLDGVEAGEGRVRPALKEENDDINNYS